LEAFLVGIKSETDENHFRFPLVSFSFLGVLILSTVNSKNDLSFSSYLFVYLFVMVIQGRKNRQTFDLLFLYQGKVRIPSCFFDEKPYLCASRYWAKHFKGPFL